MERAMQTWDYIKNHLIDREQGEWYWSCRNEEGRQTVNLDDDHAGFWKCPYHNGRMCVEAIERVSETL